MPDRAEEVGTATPVPAHECPECGAQVSEWIGIEVRGLYDGVLYWVCGECHLAWNRWEPGHFRWAKAQMYVDKHNASERAKRDAHEGSGA